MKRFQSKYDKSCSECGRTIPAGAWYNSEQEGLTEYKQCDACAAQPIKPEYQVIEDNGGGLHLYVFDARGIEGGKVIYAGTNWEYNPGQLCAALDTLDAGGDTKGWEDGLGGDLGDPQEHYNSWDKWEYGWNIVAQGADGKRLLFPEKMGTAANLEFQIEK